MKNKMIIPLFIAAALSLTGCTEIDETSPVIPTMVTEPLLSERNAPAAGSDNAETTVPDDALSDVTESTVTTSSRFIERKTDYEEYFKGCLFVGDSICSGLKLHNDMLGPETVAARGNVGTWSLNDYTFQYKNNSADELDVYSIVELKQPGEIFIWMGMNDIFMTESDDFADNLKKLADKFLELSPESRIHIISISPINSAHRWAIESDGNMWIDLHNDAVKTMCEESGYIDWINIHDTLADESGTLAPINDSGDGMHFTPEAYMIVLNQIYDYMESLGGIRPSNAPETSAETEASAETVITYEETKAETAAAVTEKTEYTETETETESETETEEAELPEDDYESDDEEAELPEDEFESDDGSVELFE